MKRNFLTVLSGLLLAGSFCAPLLTQNASACSGLPGHAVSGGNDPEGTPPVEPEPIPENPPVPTPKPSDKADYPGYTGTDSDEGGSDPDTDKPTEEPPLPPVPPKGNG